MKDYRIFLMNINGTFKEIEFKNESEMENFIELFVEIKNEERSCIGLENYEFFFRADCMEY